MRVLVACTCVAVLAAIGYFFWGEYQAKVQAEAAREEQANQIIRRGMIRIANELSMSGRCTVLAKALTDSRGNLPDEDRHDASLCSRFGTLTAFERNSFDLYPDGLK